MKRPLKFRVWSNESGLHVLTDKGMEPCPHGSYIPPSRIEMNGNGEMYDICGRDDMLDIEQFTGLIDRNGKEIYEGDILKYANGIMFVKWFEERGCFVAVSVKQVGDPGLAYYQWAMTFKHIRDEEGYIIESINQNEVIGNIHQNPELLTP